MANDDPLLSPDEIRAIVARIDRPIVLVGLMGTGKSSVGRKLAALIDAPFADADDEIEKAAQLSIPEIFAQFGEVEFRDGERRVIARLMEEHQGVLATGGGAFCNDDTRALILERGIAVWLDADIDTLVQRVSRKDNRPLLRDGDPKEILTRLRAERELAYSQAPIHVKSENGPHQRTVAQILRAIDRWL